jgi:hypothetical protein
MEGKIRILTIWLVTLAVSGLLIAAAYFHLAASVGGLSDLRFWPKVSLSATRWFGRFRRRSGPRGNIANRSLVTSRHFASAHCRIAKSSALFRHGVLNVVGTPGQLRSLARQEHGRTIPLAEHERPLWL